MTRIGPAIRVSLFAVIAAMPFLDCSHGGGDLPPASRDTLIDGLAQPIDLSLHPEGDLLIALKPGEILRIDPVTDTEHFLSYLSLDDVDHAGERGLISFALAPDFDMTQRVYVYYSKASRSRFRVSHFTEHEGRLDPDSEQLVWENPDVCNGGVHFGGDLTFGPDGKLFFTTGDEASEALPQDLTNACGKVFRLDPDGSVPADNPWSDGEGANQDGVWAMGLRNPFRATWDLPSGRFFIAEVGGNNHVTAWEDLHLGNPGANYGWPPCEGPCDSPIANCDCDSHDPPIWAYPHGGSGAAFVGGFVYRHDGGLAALQETFICGDYVQGWIKALRFSEDGRRVESTSVIIRDAGLVVSLIQGREGEIYFADLMGSVQRLRFDSP